MQSEDKFQWCVCRSHSMFMHWYQAAADVRVHETQHLARFGIHFWVCGEVVVEVTFKGVGIHGLNGAILLQPEKVGHTALCEHQEPVVMPVQSCVAHGLLKSAAVVTKGCFGRIDGHSIPALHVSHLQQSMRHLISAREHTVQHWSFMQAWTYTSISLVQKTNYVKEPW